MWPEADSVPLPYSTAIKKCLAIALPAPHPGASLSCAALPWPLQETSKGGRLIGADRLHRHASFLSTSGPASMQPQMQSPCILGLGLQNWEHKGSAGIPPPAPRARLAFTTMGSISGVSPTATLMPNRAACKSRGRDPCGTGHPCSAFGHQQAVCKSAVKHDASRKCILVQLLLGQFLNSSSSGGGGAVAHQQSTETLETWMHAPYTLVPASTAYAAHLRPVTRH